MPAETPSEALIHRFLKSLFKESDRGCALVGAAHLDRDLEKLLRSALHSASGASKKDIDYLLTNALAPLRSFAIRTRMAHALGLIPHPIRATLDAIREIRNNFAHQEDATDFPSKWIAQAIKHPMQGHLDDAGNVIDEREDQERSYKDHARVLRRLRPGSSEMYSQFVFAVVWARSWFTVKNPDAYRDYYPPNYYEDKD